MSIVRIIPSSGLALVVTGGLLLLMHILIQNDMRGPGEVVAYNVPDIVMPEREIETEYDTSKPEKPEEPDQAPPDLPEPDFDTPDVAQNAINISGPKAEAPEIGGLSALEGDMIPLAVPAPDYPRRAAQRGIEGKCEVRFTVTAQGTATDIVIGECPESVFHRSTIKAAQRLKFKPKVVDGQAVDVPNQGYVFVYQLAKE